MFSDSDDDVVPLSQRIGSDPVKAQAQASSVAPQVVDIIESSSSPIPISSSPEVEEIEQPSPIQASMSPIKNALKAVLSPTPTPRALKKNKPNTPLSSIKKPRMKSKKKNNCISAVDENVEKKSAVSSSQLVNGTTSSSQQGGKKPRAKISSRDCEARIDHSLIESHFTDEELRKAFAEFEVRFKYNTESIKPKTVTWVREVKVPDDGIVDGLENRDLSQTEWKEEKSVMILLDATEFAQMVQVYRLTNSLDDDSDVLSLQSSESSIEEIDSSDVNESPVKHNTSPSFISYCQRLCVKFHGKNLTILLIGLQAYLQKLKNKESKKYRDLIYGKDPSTRKRKSSMKHPKITREDVIEVLTDLDMNITEVSSSGQEVRILYAEKSEDIVTMIAAMTKSIAEAPHKISRNQSKTLAWFADGDKTVSTDVKSKEDIPRLWMKQLEQFPNVSQAVSKAIATAHPSPLDLYDVLSNIYDRNEAEGLLEDIAIGAKGNRRVGPEISKRICTFMTSVNGDSFLKKS